MAVTFAHAQKVGKEDGVIKVSITQTGLQAIIMLVH
jgi:hypothetical protein